MDVVRFMDEIDLDFIMDGRKSAKENQTLFEFHSRPITFRASYRDIYIITSIINKASSLSRPAVAVRVDGPKNDSRKDAADMDSSPHQTFSETPRAVVSREKVYKT